MARKWTKKEENNKRKELSNLYVKKNKSIGEIAKILYINQSTVYDRLVRLGISINRESKEKFNNQRKDIIIPKGFSKCLAEFVGVLLGDGHLSSTQTTVTLGKKDEYVNYVVDLMEKLFGAKPKVANTKRGDFVIYIGSVKLVRWFLEMGLVFNKVKCQVDFPSWISGNQNYMKAALKGFFDTDGSVYKLKYGVQFSFCNKSKPLLLSTRVMLIKLGFSPSRINKNKNIYLTRRNDLIKYFQEIGFGNKKHAKRFKKFFGCVV